MDSIVIRAPRWAISGVASTFAVFHAALGLSAISVNEDPVIAIICLSIYLVAVLASINLFTGYQMPLWVAIINLVICLLVPALIQQQLDPTHLSGSSTWYVMGMATLMAVTALRRNPPIAWLGMIYLAVQVVAWGGPQSFFTSGLIGAFMLVFVAHALSVGLDRVAKEIEKFNAERVESEALLAATSAARLERQDRIDSALKGALPMLTRIRDADGDLTENDAAEARILESSLRDEIRGRQLLNDSVRFEVNLARLRGVEVILLDEGGLADLDAEHVQELLGQVAKSVRSVTEGKVTVRAPKGEDWHITIAAMRQGVNLPDVWLRLK